MRLGVVDTGRNATSSGLQSFRPPAQPMANVAASMTPATRTITFRVPIPDPRLRTRIDVSFVPNPGTDPETGIAGSSTLWLAEANQDESSYGGLIPSQNIEGTKAAPTAIPAADGLFGYSREFWSAADYIIGTLVAGNGVAFAGQWSLQCRCSPDAVRFTMEEWQEITAKFSPRVFNFASF